MSRLLQHNLDPIKVVDQAARDVWTKLPGWRCWHADGRGQCTSRETQSIYGVGAYCERHMPEVGA